MTTTTTTCQVRVYTDSRDFRGHPCGRPVKDDGLCGLHLAAKRRRAEATAERDRKAQQDGARHEAATELAQRLRALGFKSAWPAYDHGRAGYSVPTGGVKLDAADTNELLRRLTIKEEDR